MACDPSEATVLVLEFDVDESGEILDPTTIRVSGSRFSRLDSCHDLIGTAQQVEFRALDGLQAVQLFGGP